MNVGGIPLTESGHGFFVARSIDPLLFPANTAICRNSRLLAQLSLGLEVLKAFGQRQPGLSSNSLAQESRDAYVEVDGNALHLKIMGEEIHSDNSVTVIELKSVVVSYDRPGFGGRGKRLVVSGSKHCRFTDCVEGPAHVPARQPQSTTKREKVLEPINTGAWKR